MTNDVQQTNNDPIPGSIWSNSLVKPLSGRMSLTMRVLIVALALIALVYGQPGPAVQGPPGMALHSVFVRPVCYCVTPLQALPSAKRMCWMK
jgi:hypothetical protein